jgi:hypothetical protein
MKESVEIKQLILTMSTSDIQETLARTRQIWSKEAGTDWINSAPGSYLQGYEAVIQASEAMVDTLSTPLPLFDRKIIHAFEEGSVGWVSWYTSEKLPSGKQLAWRETAVLHREDEEWKIVHVHSSLPVPDYEAYETNEAIIRQFSRVYADRDLSLLDQIFAPNLIVHQSPYPDSDFQANIASIVTNLNAFSNVTMTMDVVISKGDFVTARGVFSGVHTGVYEGIQPSGKTFSVSWMGIFRVTQGRIAEIWIEMNERIFFEQLGLAPPSQ